MGALQFAGAGVASGSDWLGGGYMDCGFEPPPLM